MVLFTCFPILTAGSSAELVGGFVVEAVGFLIPLKFFSGLDGDGAHVQRGAEFAEGFGGVGRRFSGTDAVDKVLMFAGRQRPELRGFWCVTRTQNFPIAGN